MQRFVQDFIFSFSSSINYCAFNNIAYWLTISFVEQWFNDFRMNFYCIHLLFLLILNDLCISSHKFLGKDPRSEKRGLKRIISSGDSTLETANIIASNVTRFLFSRIRRIISKIKTALNLRRTRRSNVEGKLSQVENKRYSCPIKECRLLNIHTCAYVCVCVSTTR